MRQRSDIEQEKFELLSAARGMVRLRHRIEADRELNRVLPELERKIDSAIQSGKSFDMRKQLEALLGGE
jgi:hypothetical protein